MGLQLWELYRLKPGSSRSHPVGQNMVNGDMGINIGKNKKGEE